MLGYKKIKEKIKIDEDNKKVITLNEKVYSDNSLVFEHTLFLKEGQPYNFTMKTKVTNIQSNPLKLDINGTIYSYEKNKKLFELIDFDNLKVQVATGGLIDYNHEVRKIDEANSRLSEYYVMDTLTFDVQDAQTLIIEYEIGDVVDKIEGFGGSATDTDDPALSLSYWAGFLEWIVLRPKDLTPEDIQYNILNLNLPDGWNYASTYPEKEKVLLN